MAGTPSSSGSCACYRAAFFPLSGQSTPRRSPAHAMVCNNVHTHIMYAPGSNFNNTSIMCKSHECVGNSRFYLSYHRSYYVLLIPYCLEWKPGPLLLISIIGSSGKKGKKKQISAGFEFPLS